MGLYGLIDIMLLALPGAAAARAIYCLIKLVMDDDQARLYKRRLINLLVFTVIAETALAFLFLIKEYYIGP